MKYLIILLATLTLSVNATECRKYTQEQTSLLQLAYSIGYKYDLGYTLAAIVQRESFVGDHVIRVNSKDGKYGSYGVTHINLETGMWLEGMESSWEARAKLAPKLMTNDLYAMKVSLRKLETVVHLGWKDMVRSYNGDVRSPKTLDYLNGISDNIVNFKQCGVFE